MTHEAIIEKYSRRRLVTVVPHLRLLPTPETPPERLTDAEVLAWARQRGKARGYQPRTAAERSNEDTRRLRNMGGTWHMDVTIDGRRTTRSLETQDLGEARRLRDEICQGRRVLRPGRSISIAEQSRRVLAALAEAPAGAKAVAHRTGLSAETIHRRFRELHAAGAVTKIRSGVWALATGSLSPTEPTTNS